MSLVFCSQGRNLARGGWLRCFVAAHDLDRNLDAGAVACMYTMQRKFQKIRRHARRLCLVAALASRMARRTFGRAWCPRRRSGVDMGWLIGCAVAVAMSLVLAAVGIGTITAIYVCVRRALADAGPKRASPRSPRATQISSRWKAIPTSIRCCARAARRSFT